MLSPVWRGRVLVGVKPSMERKGGGKDGVRLLVGFKPSSQYFSNPNPYVPCVPSRGLALKY